MTISYEQSQGRILRKSDAGLISASIKDALHRLESAPEIDINSSFTSSSHLVRMYENGDYRTVVFFDITGDTKYRLTKEDCANLRYWLIIGVPVIVVELHPDEAKIRATTTLHPFTYVEDDCSDFTAYLYTLEFDHLWSYLRGYTNASTGVDIGDFSANSLIWFTDELSNILPKTEQAESEGQDETYAIKA